MYHINTSSVHITTCWYIQMLPMTALYQGRTFKTRTLPDKIIVCCVAGDDCYGDLFDKNVHLNREGLE